MKNPADIELVIHTAFADTSPANISPTKHSNLFLSSEFLSALERSESVSEAKGWLPFHLQTEQLLIPAYLKNHSWGEYVFDQTWANSYAHYGYEYYPKLLAAIPFTPVPCSKIIGEQNHSTAFEVMTAVCKQQQLASWHMLFCPEQTERSENVVERLGVQFHWFNQEFGDFQDFLSTFTSRKRKNTKKERQSIGEQNIEILRVLGSDVSQQQLDFFYLCYQLTYLKRSHQPHLSQGFFEEVIKSMGNNMLFVFAQQHQDNGEVELLASALFFFDEQTLYGRYWGAIKDIPNLHFELCYYQGIEFAIQNNLRCFNPGTQGEHKIQRGFAPVFTHSYHWLAEPAFRSAISNFCAEEKLHMQSYFDACQSSLPFKDAK